MNNLQGYVTNMRAKTNALTPVINIGYVTPNTNYFCSEEMTFFGSTHLKNIELNLENELTE